MLKDHILDGRLKLRHLVLVVTIADMGTIIAASKTLNVTQPVVSRGLHEVEEMLAVQLFERSPRGVTPTIFGDIFIAHARTVIAQLRALGGQIDELAGAEIGRVHVGTHLAGSNMLLPRAIATLKDERPKLIVVVREATPDVLSSALLSGELDLMVGRLVATPTRGIRQERLYLEPIVLVARKGHQVHALENPQLSQLASYAWIFPVEQTALRAELEKAFLVEGVPIPENRIECTSMLTLRELLTSTDVIAALPMLIAYNDDKVSVIKTRLSSIRRSVGVTLPVDRPLSPAADAMVTHLRRVAAELDPRSHS